MEISFDPLKDKLNRRKHRISLSAAAEFQWDTAVVWPDLRFRYSELRECAIGLIGYRLYHVTFVERAGRRRIISLRKASAEEEYRYVGQK